MERIDSDGDSDLQPPAARAQVEKSRRRSEKSSKADRAKEGTLKAGKPPSDFAVELSLLQSVYEQALQAGLESMSVPRILREGTPILSIHLWNVSKCPDCGSWINGRTCPIC